MAIDNSSRVHNGAHAPRLEDLPHLTEDMREQMDRERDLDAEIDNNPSKKVDALTLRLAKISGAIRAAENIVFGQMSDNELLLAASDVLELTIEEIERLRKDLADDYAAQMKVSHG